MKNFILSMFFLLPALANEPSLAQTNFLFLHSLGDASSNQWRHPFQDFESRLQAAVEARDLAAIQRLYQTNGVAEITLKVELARWKQLLDEYTNVAPGMIFKELATLPRPQAYQYWTEYAHALTDREVTHLCGVTFSPGNVVRLVLPLIVVDGRFLIVPSEKRNIAPRIDQSLEATAAARGIMRARGKRTFSASASPLARGCASAIRSTR